MTCAENHAEYGSLGGYAQKYAENFGLCGRKIVAFSAICGLMVGAARGCSWQVIGAHAFRTLRLETEEP